ncbi:MAG: flagellar biosynthesis protein FlhF [Betaproteobacteria bacterium]|nr:flagellar biosynthesis protein FlhF [Betaproteobacteria bacterium]
MNVRKFVAATSREALQMVKQALGADALILSNRAVPAGVEIAALPPQDMPQSARAPAPREQAERSFAAAAPPAPAAGSARVQAFRPPHVAAENVIRGPRPKESGADRLRGEAADPRPQGGRRDQASAAEPAAGETAVMSELKAMRGLFESHLAALAWSESVRRSPLRMKFTRLALGAGFSPALVRRVLAKMPDDYGEERGWTWLADVLARNVPVVSHEDNLVSRGGVYAIVGPTGVGKTTTTAKLAARCVVRFGASKLALLTTDGYRIGAQDQLRTYGRILGVPVHVIQDEASLAGAIASLRDKHLVLIDTVGMGQRDLRVIEQVSMLANAGAARVLVLNSTAHGETIEDVIQAFRTKDLCGCILSKSDEALRMGIALDAVLRHRLPVHFVANGQRVPEDLHEPNAKYLVHRALKAPAPAEPFRLADDEFPLVMAPVDMPGPLGESANAR